MNSRLLHVAALAASLMTLGSGIARAEFSTSQHGALEVATLTVSGVTGLEVASDDACATVAVSWTRAAGADTHAVEVRRDLGLWTTLTADAGDVTTITDAASAGSTQVEYRVTPRDAASGWTGPASTTAARMCSSPP